MQSILMMASAATALLHSTLVSSAPMVADGGPTAPMPQNGIWALLPAECTEPTSIDLTTWAACAIPVGFADDEVAALEKPAPGKKASTDEFYATARTKFAMAPGAAAPDGANGAQANPLVAQVVAPMVFSRSYYYVAIVPTALDDQGRFAEASGWPVACRPKALGGCRPKTLADVQTQAAIPPTDPQRRYRLVRIRPPTAVVPPAPATQAPAASSPPAS